MFELHSCKRMEPLPRGGVQFYCTVCHAFRRVWVALGEPERENPDLPLETRRREHRGQSCGHSTGNLYVSNERNKARFGKSGSY